VKYFQTPVDIEIVTPKGSRIETVFIQPKEENIFTFKNVESNPLIVDFDNEGTLIKELTFKKSMDELLYQAKNDGDILGRNWAMQELSNLAKAKDVSASDKSKVLDFLRNAAVSDSTWQLRREAINKIGQILLPPNPRGNRSDAIALDEATITMLKRAATDKNSQVRGNAISLLSVTKDAKFADIYKNALSDQSYFVVDQTAVALGNSKANDAYLFLQKLVNTDSWKNRLQIAGLNGLAALENKQALDLAFKLGTDKSQPSNVRSAALGIVASVGKGDPKAFDLIFANFKEAVENNSFQSIAGGLLSITKLADPRGQEAFDLVKTKFKDNQQFMNFITLQEAQFKKALENNK
ncbi:MAG: HEAT repeat domain-containing protein, partial [Aridibacter sp.]